VFLLLFGIVLLIYSCNIETIRMRRGGMVFQLLTFINIKRPMIFRIFFFNLYIFSIRYLLYLCEIINNSWYFIKWKLNH